MMMSSKTVYHIWTAYIITYIIKICTEIVKNLLNIYAILWQIWNVEFWFSYICIKLGENEIVYLFKHKKEINLCIYFLPPDPIFLKRKSSTHSHIFCFGLKFFIIVLEKKSYTIYSQSHYHVAAGLGIITKKLALIIFILLMFWCAWLFIKLHLRKWKRIYRVKSDLLCDDSMILEKLLMLNQRDFLVFIFLFSLYCKETTYWLNLLLFYYKKMY